MPYVADLNPGNGQVVALRAVSAQGAETPTLKNITDEQYATMKDNAIMWHFDVATVSFKQGLLPAPNANATPMGALDLAKYNGKLRVVQFASDARNQLAGGASVMEVAGWTRYVQLAAKFDSNTLTADETAALQTEVTLRGRGETIAQLIAKVKGNDAKYTKAQAAVNGMVKAASDQIDACTQPTQVDAVLAALKSQASALMAQLMSGA
jgi:hypothetical protein